MLTFAVAFVLVLLTGPVSGADERAMVLHWTAPPECPRQADVEERVRVLVGPDAKIAGTAAADVVFTHARFEATVTLQTEGGTTTRSFAAEQCGAVAEAVALVVAVGLDPLAVSTVVREVVSAEANTPPPIVPPTTPLEPVSTPTTPPSIERTTTRARRPSLGLRGFVQGAAAVGVLPGVGGVVGGGLALRIDAARVELSGSHEIGRRFVHPDDPAAGALVSASVGRVAACWTPEAGRFIFPLCAGAEIGAMTARGRGLSDPGTVRTVWATAVPHFRALWFPIPRVGFGPVLELPIALVRPRFSIDDYMGDLVKAGPVGVRFGLVVEVSLKEGFARPRGRGSCRGFAAMGEGRRGPPSKFDDNRRTRR